MALVYESILDVGDEVPSFDLDSQLGRVMFRDIVFGRWCLLVTFGMAFDPVSTTDLGMLGKLKEEFDEREILIVAIGADTVPNYRLWLRDIEEINATKITYSLLSDPSMKILKSLGCARDGKDGKTPQIASYGLFLIDLDARIRYSSRSSPYLGRNLYESLRQFDAHLIINFHPIVCPCNWGQGQQVLMRNSTAISGGGAGIGGGKGSSSGKNNNSNNSNTNNDTKEMIEYKATAIKPWFKLAPCPEKI